MGLAIPISGYSKIDLLNRVCTVSLETVRIVGEMEGKK